MGSVITFISNIFSTLQLPVGFWRKLVLFGLAAFFINFGVDHFINPDFYLSIMPPAFPLHPEAVYISGFFEVLFGFLILFKKFRFIIGWSLIALLIAVFPANIYLAMTNGLAMNTTPLIAWVRLPFQFMFIYLAYWHTKDS